MQKLIFTKSVFILLSIALSFSAFSQDTCNLRIGTNLDAVTDWNKELPFVDLMKGARSWITQNVVWVNGGSNPWDSQVQGEFEYDENGYPLEVPLSIDGQEADQCLATLMARDLNGEYPAGVYTVLYDGEGQLDFDLDAVSVVGQQTGEYEIEVVPGNGGILMRIVQSNPENHLRNIRVLMPGTEESYLEDPFHNQFIDKLEPFSVIRFMNWGRTNNNPLVEWSDRTTTSNYTQATAEGVAYEYMVDLCNYTGKDMWLCVPHKADSNFVENLSELIHANLDPELNLYLEYTNEFWNGIFSQHQWVLDNAPESVGGVGYEGAWPKKYAWFAEKVFNAFENEFEGENERLIRVASGQHYNPWIMGQIMDYLGEDGADAISPAAYFTFGGEGEQHLSSLGANATPGDIVPFIQTEMTEVAYPLLEDHKELADQYNLELLFYEGGQHVTSIPFGTSQPYEQALWDLQTDQAMYDLYNEWFTLLRDSLEADGFMHYLLASPQQSVYGSWGALESVMQSEPFPPKYEALLDNIELCTDVSVPEFSSLDNRKDAVFVNPASDKLQLINEMNNCRHLTMKSLNGQEVLNQSNPQFPMGLSEVPTGIYIIELYSKDKIYRQRILIE